MSRVIRSSRR